MRAAELLTTKRVQFKLGGLGSRVPMYESLLARYARVLRQHSMRMARRVSSGARLSVCGTTSSTFSHGW